MGVLRFIGRQALHLGFASHIAAGAQLVQQNWRRVCSRPCPSCHAGRMHPFMELVDGKARSFRGCDQCAHFEALEAGTDADTIERLRDISNTRLQEMGAGEVDQQMQKFRRLSRVWYALALCMMSGGASLVLFDAMGLTFVFFLLFSLNLAANGMVASYRHWQLGNRMLFVKGAFKQWIKAGAWII